MQTWAGSLVGTLGPRNRMTPIQEAELFGSTKGEPTQYFEALWGTLHSILSLFVVLCGTLCSLLLWFLVSSSWSVVLCGTLWYLFFVVLCGSLHFWDFLWYFVVLVVFLWNFVVFFGVCCVTLCFLVVRSIWGSYCCSVSLGITLWYIFLSFVIFCGMLCGEFFFFFFGHNLLFFVVISRMPIQNYATTGWINQLLGCFCPSWHRNITTGFEGTLLSVCVCVSADAAEWAIALGAVGASVLSWHTSHFLEAGTLF